MEEQLKKQKKIRFSRAGASHQNGATERTIKTTVTVERTRFMHAVLICPEEKFCTNIWKMSMDYSVWINNRIPDIKFLLYAIDIWSR